MLPIHKLHPDVDDWIPRFDARLQRLFDAVLNGRDELARDGAADDLVLKLEAGAALQRLDVKLDDAELAAAAGLAHEAPLGVGGLSDRLLVGHFRPADVRLMDGAAGIIAEANGCAIPVIMVTNQAGIAHGHFGWAEFIQVQDKILDDLAAEGAFVNGVFACPHHGGGRAPYDVENHPWRKPNPGMLLAAAERLPLDLGQSWIIGDRAGDLEAGKNAALAGGLHVLTGHGADDGERDAALALAGANFQALAAPTIAGATVQLPLFQGGLDGAP